MGAALLAAGAPGKRYALPHARIMIHQPSGGSRGQATDIMIQAEEILRMKKELNGLLARLSGQPVDKVSVDTERDFFMSASEAFGYGLIDAVMERHVTGA